MIYRVEWIEMCPQWADFEADSEAEAIQKAKRHDFIEGTRDSEPGRDKPNSYLVGPSPTG